MKQKLLSAFALALVASTAADAHAYVDPGAGSMVLQLLLGGIAGGWIFLKMYWRRLRTRQSNAAPSTAPSDAPGE